MMALAAVVLALLSANASSSPSQWGATPGLRNHVTLSAAGKSLSSPGSLMHIDGPMLLARLRGGKPSRGRRMEEEEDSDEVLDDESEYDESESGGSSLSDDDSDHTPRRHVKAPKKVIKKFKKAAKQRRMREPEPESEESSMEDEEEDEEDEMEVPEEDYQVAPKERDWKQKLGLPQDTDEVAGDADEARDKTEAKGVNIITIPFEGHSDTLCASLRSMQKAGKMTDVILVTSDGTKIACHKAVLASTSPTLSRMVEALKGTAHTLSMDTIDSATMELVVDYVYSGSASVSEDRVHKLLGAAQKLGLSPLREACISHLLKGLTPHNAVETRTAAEALQCSELADAAHNLIMEEFLDVAASPAFHALSHSEVAKLLASDDLLVESEEDVFGAVIRWVSFDEAARAPALLPLLATVRLGLLPLHVLASKVAANPTVQKLLGSNAEFQKMLNAAVAFVGSSPEQRVALHHGPQTRARLGSKGRFLVCVGGRRGGSSSALRRCYMLDRITAEWFEIDHLRVPRKQLATAEAGGKIYAVGGWDGAKYLRSVEAFDPSVSTWVRAPSLATARGSFGLVSSGESLIAAGGFDGHRHLASCERLRVSPSAQAHHGTVPAAAGTVPLTVNGSTINTSATPGVALPISHEWEELPPLSSPRSGLRLAAIGEHIYAVGGFNGTEVMDVVERFAKGKWEAVAPMTSARRDLALEVVDGELYAAGGFDGTKDLDTVEKYNPATNTWTALAPMNAARSGLALKYFNKRLHAIGGYNGAKYLSAAERLDPRSPEDGEWCSAIEASLPSRMAHFGAALL